MLDANRFVESLSARSHTFFTGVPCSFLTPLIHAVEGLGKGFYVPATSEGEAVAVAAGAWLAGQPAVVLSQNSGLGNMINPLTSLTEVYRRRDLPPAANCGRVVGVRTSGVLAQAALGPADASTGAA